MSRRGRGKIRESERTRGPHVNGWRNIAYDPRGWSTCALVRYWDGQVALAVRLKGDRR